MLKKLLILFTVCAFLGGTGQALGIRPRPKAKARHTHTSRSTKKKSSTLQKRREDSFAKSTTIQQTHPRGAKLIDSRPYSSIFPEIQGVQNLYPHLGNHFNTPQQWADYILANQNRRVAARTLMAEQHWQELNNNFYSLYRQQQIHLAQEKEYGALLAQQIPPETQYILLGEAHEPVVLDTAIRFLTQLRAQQPEREIILLTEFLPEGTFLEAAGENWSKKPIMPDGKIHQYQQIFTVASRENMPVIGLEPSFVEENKHVLCGDSERKNFCNLWKTLEGTALRNERWLPIIRQQRQEHPNALFVIYAGAMHLAYRAPYSIGDALPPKQTFTALLLPYRLVKNQLDNLVSISPYDALCLERDIPASRFITFDKPYAKQVGFDARIFVENP